MINFQDTFNELIKQSRMLASDSLNDYAKDAEIDGEAVLNKMKKTLERWTLQLANNELSKDDFAFLVRGQKDLMEMVALKRAGMASINIDQFKDKILNLVTSTVFQALKF